MSKGFEDYRMGHLVRTAGLWRQLVELGATESSKLDFDFQFTANNVTAVESLKAELSDYPIEMTSQGLFKKTFLISGRSGAITWSEDQLLEWVDYLIQVGHDAGCEFEGCGASAP